MTTDDVRRLDARAREWLEQWWNRDNSAHALVRDLLALVETQDHQIEALTKKNLAHTVDPDDYHY